MRLIEKWVSLLDSRTTVLVKNFSDPACAIVLNGRGSIFETTAAQTVQKPVIKIEFNNHGLPNLVC